MIKYIRGGAESYFVAERLPRLAGNHFLRDEKNIEGGRGTEAEQ